MMTEKAIWDNLKGRGLSDVAVAGIMGNLYAESGLRADNLQDGFEARLGMTDAQYTAAVDSGTYANFVRDGAGYGLAQWTYWSRKGALLGFARDEGKPIGDAAMQLDFLWRELQGFARVMDALRSARLVREASDAVMLWYEMPADQSEAAKKRRTGYGQGYHDRFAAASMPVTPFVARIKKGAAIRRGPAAEFSTTGEVPGDGAYTIVEVCDGYGWLKSGAGWVNLADAEPV